MENTIEEHADTSGLAVRSAHKKKAKIRNASIVAGRLYELEEMESTGMNIGAILQRTEEEILRRCYY